MTTEHFWKLHVTFDPEMGIGGESMHAERLGDGPDPHTGLYKVGNIPFFADLRLHDIVVCDETDPEEIPEFVRVHEQSPQETVRVIFKEHLTNEEMSTVAETLRKLGSNTERGSHTLWAIALPADPDKADLAIEVLEAGVASGVVEAYGA